MKRRSRGPESRPEPRKELMASLGEDQREPSRRRVPRGRVALAGALCVAFLAVFVGLGGVGAAASSLGGVGPSATAADFQYAFPQWVCLRKQQDKKPEFKWKLLYAQEPGDFDGWTVDIEYGQTPGPCPNLS